MDIATRKRLHLEFFNYSDNYQIYFTTICIKNKINYLLNSNLAKNIIDQLKFRRNNNEIKLYAYCIMPDHIHLLLSLGESYRKNLQNWMESFKRYTSKIAKANYQINHFWQKNFYDHIIRKEESLVMIVEYILNNPVRKGMVLDWRDYPFSGMMDDLPI